MYQRCSTSENLNYNNNAHDQINDQINDQISDIGLEILKIIQNNPGIKVQGIYDALIGSNSAGLPMKFPPHQIE